MLPFLLLAILLTVCASGNAANSGSLKTIHVREDGFVNYDFEHEAARHTEVDWAVNFVFYGRATIDRVKSKLSPWLWAPGSRMHAHVNNGDGWQWDSDGGIKSAWCSFRPGSSTLHLRVYAPPAYNYLYNGAWGMYVIGTSHFDYQECYKNSWFGRSELAEHLIANDARQVSNWTVYEDYANFSNFQMAYSPSLGKYVPYREGNHVWENNAWATFVHVPRR